MDKILTGHELPSFADTYSRVNRIVRGQSDSPSGSDNITFVSQNSNGTSVTQLEAKGSLEKRRNKKHHLNADKIWTYHRPSRKIKLIVSPGRFSLSFEILCMRKDLYSQILLSLNIFPK